MNRITQEAKKRQGVVLWAKKHGKSAAARQYGVSLSSVKRWCKRYDGSWQSLRERSHRPQSSPRRHSEEEESLLREMFVLYYMRYGWDGVYREAGKRGYTRSLSGMVYAVKRMGLGRPGGKKKPPRKQDRRYPELTKPGEKVQVDVKEVPYNCLKGKIKEDGKHLYQWTAIDECTRMRFIYSENLRGNNVWRKWLAFCQKGLAKHNMICYNENCPRNKLKNRNIFCGFSVARKNKKNKQEWG